MAMFLQRINDGLSIFPPLLLTDEETQDLKNLLRQIRTKLVTSCGRSIKTAHSEVILL